MKKCIRNAMKRARYFPPEVYSLALCGGSFSYTGALDRNIALAMVVVTVTTTAIRKLLSKI